MSKFSLEIITPEKILDMGEVSYVRCPGVDGLFGIQANHARALISLDIGEIKVVIDGTETFIATSGGYAEIDHDKTQLLVETAEEASKIDTDRANKSVERARERMDQAGVIDVERAERALARGLNRLKIARR